MKPAIVLLAVLTLSALAGCATPSLRSVVKYQKINFKEGEVLVFGRLVITENGEDKTPYSLLRRPMLVVFGRDTGNAKRETRIDDIDEDGNFYWLVKPGWFRIKEIHYDPSDYIVMPDVTFCIESGYRGYYIGTLRIDTTVYGKKFLRISSVHIDELKSVQVVDDFDNARSALVRRNPEAQFDLAKALMVCGNSPTAMDRKVETRSGWWNIGNPGSIGGIKFK